MWFYVFYWLFLYDGGHQAGPALAVLPVSEVQAYAF